jgi:hypothetical protein
MKKVSVGTVKDVGPAPQKSRKKGFIILVVVAVVLIALFLIGNTGCSSKGSSTATPAPTVVPIPQRVSGLESRVLYLEQHPVAPTAPFDPSGLQALINALTTRVGAAETAIGAINISVLQQQIADFNASLSYLNLSLYSHLHPSSNVTPTPTPNASATATPTPTPTSTVAPTCLMPTKPVLTLPATGATDVPIVTNLYWDSCDNADHYEVWITGISPMPMITNVSGYAIPLLSSNTTYNWKIVAVSDCGLRNDSAVFNFKTVP